MDQRSERARQRREARRRQILEAGLRVFAREGYHGATVDDVIRAAGVARGTFYLYFPSKHDLFEVLLDELIAELDAQIRRVDLSPGAPPPLEQLRQNVVRLLELPRARPELLQLLLWEAAGGEGGADKIVGLHRRMFALTRRSLETGIAMGLVRPCDTDLAARCLVGVVKEALLSLYVRRDLDRPASDDVAREILDFATRGLMRG